MVHPGEDAAGPEEVDESDAAPVVVPDDEVLTIARSRVGRTLRSKWRLDTLLGVGGMAAVYAATHRNGGRAAVKILHPEMSGHPIVRARFLREGYVANAVGHPGVVRVIDDDSADDGSLFLVTELLEGETLEERCNRLGGRLPEREVLPVVDKVLDVLAAAHGRGIIHRDIKPDNVFLTRAGQVKLLDFGIARLEEHVARKRLTQTGIVMGTPAYMAPEYASGHADKVDPRSDLWACGATIYRLLTGEDVHAGGTLQEQLVSAVTKPAQPLASKFPRASALVAELVDRSLAFDKLLRWPDARAMQAVLRRAYEEIAGHPIESASPLTVGDTALHRTRAPTPERLARLTWAAERETDSPLAGEHGEPVDTTAIRRRIAPWTRRRWALVAAGGVLVALAVAWTAARSERAQATRSPELTRQPVPQPTAPAGEPGAQVPEALEQPTAPPLVSVHDLPVARDPRRDDRKNTAAAGSAGAAGGKVDCHPPYVIDGETGKKRWKLECL
jgi:serine/threonine-protein kinase